GPHPAHADLANDQVAADLLAGGDRRRSLVAGARADRLLERGVERPVLGGWFAVLHAGASLPGVAAWGSTSRQGVAAAGSSARQCGRGDRPVGYRSIRLTRLTRTTSSQMVPRRTTT